jgi:hypothetical protein
VALVLLAACGPKAARHVVQQPMASGGHMMPIGFAPTA